MPPLLRRSKHLHLNLREFNAEGRGCLRVVIHGAVDLIQTVHRSMVAGGDGHDAGASDAAGGEVLALAQQNSEGGMCETRHMSHIHVTCHTFTSQVTHSRHMSHIQVTCHTCHTTMRLGRSCWRARVRQSSICKDTIPTSTAAAEAAAAAAAASSPPHTPQPQPTCNWDNSSTPPPRNHAEPCPPAARC